MDTNTGWLICPNCGHECLETNGTTIFASYLGEPCMYCNTPIVRKEEAVTTRFSSETSYDSVVNHFGFDIEEEEDFKLWLDHRRIPIDSDRLPDEATRFIEARKRLSNPSQHANPNHDKRSKATIDVEDRHLVPSWIKSGRHG